MSLSYHSDSNFSYQVINLSFIFIVVLVVVYSFVFAENNHPIPSIYSDYTGELSPSKGLSAGFSNIVRGNVDLALNHNPHSVRVFSFFAIQLLLRVFFLLVIRIYPTKIARIAFSDAFVSLAIFAWCFAPLIKFTINQFLRLL
jgi:hypothetical protein